MTMWCNSNWGELLQPAPLTVSLLGSIIILAASTTDFSLVSTGEAKPYIWQYALYPGSFKTCLQQMVGDGLTAYESAEKEMTTIRDLCSGLPATIADAVKIILQGSPREVELFLPNTIESALQSAKECRDAASRCEAVFQNICGLAQELMLACTNKVGTTEQKLEANQQLVEILLSQEEQDRLITEQAKETNELFKDSFTKAENDFHEAVANVPKGWDIVGMQVVENLTQFAISAGNAAIGMATIRAQAMQAGLGAVQDFAKPKGSGESGNGNAPPAPGGGGEGGGVEQPPGPGSKTLPNADSLTDPGLTEAGKIQGYVDALNQLVRGGEDYAPDWNMITGDSTKGPNSSGAVYVENALGNSKRTLTKGKPISDLLIPVVTDALRIVDSIQKIARSADSSDDNALHTYWKPMDTLVHDINGIVMQCNLILQQPATKGAGPATPQTPLTNTTSATQLAIESSKRVVDQTRGNLEASRDSYDRAATRLIESQKQLSQTISEMTSLNLTNAGLKAMLPVLKKAVGAFTTLRAQFSQLLQFFISVASLLNNVLGPNIERWAKTMENTAEIAGVTIGDLSRQLIYAQMMVPLKVSVLSQKIADSYLDVSRNFIMPAQRQIGTLMTFPTDNSPEAQEQHLRELSFAQGELKKSSEEASKKIAGLIEEDQRKFRDAIATRLTQVVNVLAPVYPAVEAPLPRQIEDIKEEHVANFDKQDKTEKNKNPMYDVSDAI